MSCLKELVHCIDSRIIGDQNINEENIDFKSFIAGYLGQILKTEAFNRSTTEIREQICHLYFLVHLMCKFDDFKLVLKEYSFVQISIQNGTVTWEDSDYFRIWERNILLQFKEEEDAREHCEIETGDIIKEDSLEHEGIIDAAISPLHSCEECNFVSSSENMAVQHKVEKHGKNALCGICNEAFTSYKLYRFHVKAHVTKMCQICGKSVLCRKNGYESHLKTHGQDRENICPICGKSVINILNHAQTHKEKNYACPHCDFRTNVEYQLKMHVKRRHSEAKFVTCHLCGTKLKHDYKESRINDHIKRRCSANPDRIRSVCNICMKTFATQRGLLVHTRNYHEELAPKIKCGQCDYQSIFPNNMFMHKKRVHEGKPLREKCHLCEKKVIVLSTHMSIYHGELSVNQDVGLYM